MKKEQIEIWEELGKNDGLTFEITSSEEYILYKAYEKINFLQPLAYDGNKVILASQLSVIFNIPHSKITSMFCRMKNNLYMKKIIICLIPTKWKNAVI